MIFAKKNSLIIVVFVFFLSACHITSFVSAQTPTPNIDQLKQKVAELGQQKRTLQSQIQQMDIQISLTSLQIQSSEKKILETQTEIEKLGSRINNLDASLNTLSRLLLRQITKSYKTRTISLIDLLFETKDVNDLANKIKYLHASQNNNQKLLVQVQEAKSSYEEQKVIREQKKTELDHLIVNLNAQKEDLKTQQTQKERLLTDTNNDENTYQTLLTQAEAQLKGFGSFVANQGGSSLLSNQTSCDDWGCYYNQRDSQWGGNSLNNTGYTIASDGCLITSMAMVYTHFGHRGVTPQTINSNPFNFASYYPAYLNMTIVADGVSATRVYSTIDSELSSGRPVIVGISYDGGPNPDHFLVLISGSNGDYKMNDPYTPNGHNIPFTDHYSVGSIRTINKINI